MVGNFATIISSTPPRPVVPTAPADSHTRRRPQAHAKAGIACRSRAPARTVHCSMRDQLPGEACSILVLGSCLEAGDPDGQNSRRSPPADAAGLVHVVDRRGGSPAAWSAGSGALKPAARWCSRSSRKFLGASCAARVPSPAARPTAPQHRQNPGRPPHRTLPWQPDHEHRRRLPWHPSGRACDSVKALSLDAAGRTHGGS